MVSRFIECSLIFSSLLVVGSELLGFFEAFSFWPVLFLWAVAGLFSAVHWKRLGVGSLPLSRLERAEWILVGLLGILLLFSLAGGLVTPPQSWDPFVYHVPRQVRWIQQAGFDHFPTYVNLQLYREPFAEMMGANLLLLTGSDHSISLVQWTAYLLVLLVVYQLGRRLRASRISALFGSLMTAAVPIAYLQASTAKNDLVFGCWFLVAAWCCVRLFRERAFSARFSLFTGLAFGLMVLTKGAAYLLGLPLVVLVVYVIARREGKRSWKSLLIMASLALALNLGHYGRNYSWFGSPLGPPESRSIFLNESWAPRHLLSRFTREISLHMGTPVESLNRGLELSVRKVHEIVRLGLEDPLTTYPGRPFRILYLPGNEYQASAPLHLFLAVLLPAGALYWRREIRGRLFWILLPAPYLSFLVWVWIAKWEPYQAPRLHLPIQFLVAALAAALFSLPALRKWVLPVALLFFISVLPSEFYSRRSVLGFGLREDRHLILDGSPLQDAFLETADYVRSRHPGVVGLISNGANAFEYPMMKLLMEDLYTPHFTAFNREPAGAGGELEERVPDLVIAFRPMAAQTHSSSRIRYLPAKEIEPFVVLLREESK